MLGGLEEAVQRAGCSIVFTQCGKSLSERFTNGLAVFEEATFFKQCRPILLMKIERLQLFQLVFDVIRSVWGCERLSSSWAKRSCAALNAA